MTQILAHDRTRARLLPGQARVPHALLPVLGLETVLVGLLIVEEHGTESHWMYPQFLSLTSSLSYVELL